MSPSSTPSLLPFLLPFLLLSGRLLCSFCPVSADYSLNLYNDSQCTIPSTVLPSVSNTQLGVAVNNSACVSASSFPQAWIPTPGTPQWVGYICSKPGSVGSYLDVCIYDYSTSTGQCPFNGSDPYTCRAANASVIVFPTTYAPRGCKLVEYTIYDVSLGQTTSTSLYGNFSCSSTASTPSNGARAASQPHVATLLIVVIIAALVASLH